MTRRGIWMPFNCPDCVPSIPSLTTASLEVDFLTGQFVFDTASAKLPFRFVSKPDGTFVGHYAKGSALNFKSSAPGKSKIEGTCKIPKVTFPYHSSGL